MTRAISGWASAPSAESCVLTGAGSSYTPSSLRRARARVGMRERRRRGEAKVLYSVGLDDEQARYKRASAPRPACTAGHVREDVNADVERARGA
jgi:hypothetical protein